MPDVQTTGTPPAFPASIPLTELERDLLAWYRILPTAHKPAPRPAYIGSAVRPEVVSR